MTVSKASSKPQNMGGYEQLEFGGYCVYFLNSRELLLLQRALSPSEDFFLLPFHMETLVLQWKRVGETQCPSELVTKAQHWNSFKRNNPHLKCQSQNSRQNFPRATCPHAALPGLFHSPARRIFLGPLCAADTSLLLRRCLCWSASTEI